MSLDLISPLAARAASAVAAIAAVVAAVTLSGLAASPARAQPAKPAAAVAPVVGKAPIFVLNSLDANVSVIDPVTYQEIRRVPTGKEPHHLYLSPDEKSLLVANALADSLTMLDPRTGEVQRVVTGIPDPYQLKFSPDMKWFLTAANRLNHVDIYRTTPRVGGGVDLALAKRVPTGKTPSHIATDSKSTVAYVTMQDSDELVAIDLATQAIRWRSPTGKMPADVFVTPDDRHLLIGLTGDRAAEVYDVTGAKPVLVKRIPSGDGAHAFRAWGDKRHVLLSNRAGNTISRIDLQTFTVVATYPAPGGPDCMDVLADGKTILVTSRWARKLTVIDTVQGKVVRQIPVGRSPHGVWTLDHAARQ
ncbi:YVTN family beta-propeller protein [Aquabacterium commune]|uniref:YVTN family beta-propeller protein n=1 Tax=Aquabacterium commune TaxID=70586 RepID=A0A4R6R814_9BURK|nr:YncE family protein [Aquabacterium commune]TDP82150.1 YVTN family beta-propeller protein [Aquabacterium commune]